jgi:hypothetical protein
MNTIMATVGGSYVDINAPDPRTIKIEDIAHSLGTLCRFSGHTWQFYSVAEHSVLAATLAERRCPDDPGFCMLALLHDAHEAYLSDIPSPVKRRLFEAGLDDEKFRHVTGALDCAIRNAVAPGLGSPAGAQEEELHRIDAILLATEAETFFNAATHPEHWRLGEPPDMSLTICGWLPGRAQIEFVRAYRRLAAAIEAQAATSEAVRP